MTDKVSCNLCGSLILPTTAEKTSGICMRCKREGPPKQSHIVQLAYKHPARCLEPFSVDTHGAILSDLEQRIECARFQISCQCGFGEFEIHGYPMDSLAYPDERIFAAPIIMECLSCKKREQIFDPRHDGYDGEIDSSAGVIGSGSPSPFLCSECSSSTFIPAVSLEYAVEDEEMDEWDELAQTPQNYFTWFNLMAKCTKCGILNEITNYECA